MPIRHDTMRRRCQPPVGVTATIVLAVLLLALPPAYAAKIGFDSLTHGQVLSTYPTNGSLTSYQLNDQVTLSINEGDTLIVFDTTEAVHHHQPTANTVYDTSEDPPVVWSPAGDGDSDLSSVASGTNDDRGLSAWGGENGAGETGNLPLFQGKLMTVAENTVDLHTNTGAESGLFPTSRDSADAVANGVPDGLIDVPDDKAGDATITIKFSVEMMEFSLEIADYDDSASGGGHVDLYFYLDDVLKQTIVMDDFGDSSSTFYDSTIEFNNHTMNELPLLSTANPTNHKLTSVFDRVDVALTSTSGAFGAITYQEVPEPGSFTALLLAVGAFALRRRRRAA